jgi:hypothetical protein
MDEIEHAVEVGQRLADVVAVERNAVATSGSSHVDSIARALLENVDNPPRDEAGESEEEDSDELMETELCEVSDPEAWMVMHHGSGETSESEQMEDDETT